jgi:hypothetical protein
VTALGPIDRRSVLRALGIGGSMVLVGWSRPWSALVEVVPPSDATRLASVFAPRASARAIGEAHLRRAPDEPVDGIVDRIAAGFPDGKASLHRADDAALKGLVLQAVADDFARDRTIAVDGWILSRTEVDVYSLVALLERS